jgi:hypothetical protein
MNRFRGVFMVRKFLLAAIVSTSVAVFGQATTNGYVNGVTGNGQIAASTVTFASPATTAGISEAGVAGISDHTPPPPIGTLVPSTVVYTNSGANYMAAPEATAERPVTDLGPSMYVGNGAASANALLSLGEVAVQNKVRNRAQNARSYTNTDVQRLLSRNGSGNVMEAANRTPSGIPAAAQNTQASATTTAPSQNISSTASNSVQPVAPTNNSPAVPSGSGVQSGNSGTGQSAMPNATEQSAEAQNAQTDNVANAGTTPQIAQPRRSESQEANRLPATSTLLPLLGLIGLATGGAGLWYRRNQKQ